ncbi:CPBP family intramembrane glutamic endopeptidase [Dyadobacter crusticola]|uniref:CPBP family intramembrane glutamic endopeptidase n=1 Tax=Dyadobacter crusticola TaxID=292407 RepID=UPI0004E1F6A3|nr:CPBP family intramembrane glutamic endopeptidase [Dyadobacter crusticola]
MQESQEVSTKYKLQRILLAYLAVVLFKFIYANFLVFLKSKGLIGEAERASSMRTLSSAWITLSFLFEVAIAGPIMEELAFRGTIVHVRRVVVISSVFLLYMLAARFTGVNFYVPGMDSGLIFVLAALFVFLFSKPISGALISVTGKNRIATILISSACFALWHHSNFNFSQANAFEITLNLLPHFVSGILFAFVALRYGIQWSILLHMLNNAVPVIVVLAT